MSADYIYEPYIHTQSNAASYWTVEHNFDRYVNIQVYIIGDDTGDGLQEVFPKIDIVDENSFIIDFFENGVASSQIGIVVVT